jgi:hypothetical protein
MGASRRTRAASIGIALALGAFGPGGIARAQPPAPPAPAPAAAAPPPATAPEAPADDAATGPADEAAPPDVKAETEPETEIEGFVMPAGQTTTPALTLMGYVDFGYANAGGNGTSFPPGDYRLPADYGVDTFAPAVNSRGDVASIDSGGRFTNGFLPRTVSIAGRPSFLINTVSQDLRYQAPHVPFMAFVRVQALPRWGGDGAGNETVVVVEQAFGRVTPFNGREFFITGGKFDSVFGIEYLENQANYRTGITPSLLARYTTGTTVGLKMFYRQQIAPLWSALSLNIAATNGGTFVEALQPVDASLTGRPVGSARLGYELNLPRLQIKAGASGLRGPRNDQFDREALLTMFGFDLRINIAGLTLSGEYVDVDEEEGAGGKQTGAGEYPVASAFYARGFWAQAAYAITIPRGPLRAIVPYARYEQRRAGFEGFRPITVARVTGGLRLDLWESLILKAELLVNQELAGAPVVDNNVLTTSAVYSW